MYCKGGGGNVTTRAGTAATAAACLGGQAAGRSNVNNQHDLVLEGRQVLESMGGSARSGKFRRHVPVLTMALPSAPSALISCIEPTELPPLLPNMLKMAETREAERERDWGRNLWDPGRDPNK